jgi:hypothetical protein
MQTVRSGDIIQVTIDGNEFDPKGDTGCDIFPGGYSNEAAANGNKTVHVTQKVVLGGFDNLALSIDDSASGLEKLQLIANSGNPVPVSMTLPSGVTYQGSLVLVGEVKKSTADGVATISARGEKFEQV